MPLQTVMIYKMENTHNLKEICKNQLDYICLNSSCHGGNWAMKIKSTKLRILLQILFLIFQFGLFGAVIQIFLLEPFEMTTNQHYITNDGSYPNVTLCNHRIFDKATTEGLYIFTKIEAFFYFR